MTDSEAILHRYINKAANEFSERQGCNILTIEPCTTGKEIGYNITAEMVEMKRNYFTLIHAINFNNRVVRGFVSLDDLDG